MNGETALIKIHLFPNGMYVECEALEDGKFIPLGDAKPLLDFINDVQEFYDPDTVFMLTEKGKKMLEEPDKDTEEL